MAACGQTQRRMVSAAIGTAFVQETPEAAKSQWRSVTDQLRGKFPKRARQPTDVCQLNLIGCNLRERVSFDGRKSQVPHQEC